MTNQPPQTERHICDVITPAQDSLGSITVRRPDILMKFIMAFMRHTSAKIKGYLEINHEISLPHLFKLIIINHCTIRFY